MDFDEILDRAERMTGAMVVDDHVAANEHFHWFLDQPRPALYVATQLWCLELLHSHRAIDRPVEVALLGADGQVTVQDIPYVDLGLDILRNIHRDDPDEAERLFAGAEQETACLAALWLCEQCALRHRDLTMSPN